MAKHGEIVNYGRKKAPTLQLSVEAQLHMPGIILLTNLYFLRKGTTSPLTKKFSKKPFLAKK
jgi:hypothetical protein